MRDYLVAQLLMHCILIACACVVSLDVCHAQQVGEQVIDISLGDTSEEMEAEIIDSIVSPPSPDTLEATVDANGNHVSKTSAGADADKFNIAVRKAVNDYLQMSVQTTWRCVSLLAYALIIVAGAVYLTVRGHFNQLVAFKLIALTMVITSGLVLIVAGFSNDQITSMMGLLGTVAGYVLGKGEDHLSTPPAPPATSAVKLPT
jgi:hypothetical protein